VCVFTAVAVTHLPTTNGQSTKVSRFTLSLGYHSVPRHPPSLQRDALQCACACVQAAPRRTSNLSICPGGSTAAIIPVSMSASSTVHSD